MIRFFLFLSFCEKLEQKKKRSKKTSKTAKERRNNNVIFIKVSFAIKNTTIYFKHTQTKWNMPTIGVTKWGIVNSDLQMSFFSFNFYFCMQNTHTTKILCYFLNIFLYFQFHTMRIEMYCVRCEIKWQMQKCFVVTRHTRNESKSRSKDWIDTLLYSELIEKKFLM